MERLAVEAVLRGAKGATAAIRDLEDSGVIAPGERCDFPLLRANPLDGLRTASGGPNPVFNAGEANVAPGHTETPFRPPPPDALD